MAIKIIPLTKRQLVGYFNDYRGDFPDWEVEHDVMLTRSFGLVKQQIWFEALRSGAYRPASCVKLLIKPKVSVLFSFLDIKHREVFPREHAAKRPLVMEAMEAQFKPSIRKPLEVVEVLQLAEDEVIRDKIVKTHYSVALAALNACVGNLDRATWWCDRVQVQLAGLEREPAAYEQEHMEYVGQLHQAIIDGQTQMFLQAGLIQ